MRTGTKILIVLTVFFVVASFWGRAAGQRGDNAGPDTTKAKKKKETPVYLGYSNLTGGNISIKLFDSLVKQGIVAKDSAGNVYRVDGFMFTYAEVKLYEDSAGNLQWMTDFEGEYCKGNKVDSLISGAIHDRLKIGDTLYFDNISIQYANGGIVTNGRPMRFEITSK